MKKRLFFVFNGIFLTGIAMILSMIPAMSAEGGAERSYMIISKTNRIPAGLDKNIKALNGRLEQTIPEIGIATAASDDPNFHAAAASLPGIRSVVPDVAVQWIDPNTPAVEGVSQEAYGNPPASSDDDFYFDLQWDHDAVNSPEAWSLGAKGAGVKVFVLDSGIDSHNPDLVPNLNKPLCRSFVPGEDWDVQPGFFFHHGTHVAGIIAAADNAYGVIGVAPEAELAAVKVLSEYTGRGAFSWVNAGIVYAANSGADVINMSLSARFPRHGYMSDSGTPNDPSDDIWIGANIVAEWCVAQQRAVTYAYQKGVTVVVAAGNESIDADHTADFISVPAQLANVICVSATAPYGWAYAFTANLDEPASYTNFGQSMIDFSAPGGDWDFYYNPNAFVTRTVAGLSRYCYVFDYVFSTSSGGWWWASGTSMATPHVAGVAALIIGVNGRPMPPARVEAVLRGSADDLSKPGKDNFYGLGRVNAFRAVTSMKN